MADGGALRSVLAFFGVKVDTKELDKASWKVQSFTDVLKDASKKLKGGFGFEDLGTGSLVKSLQSDAGAIGKAAKTAGVGVNDIQRLMHQTGKGADDLTRVFRVLGRNMSLATAKQGADNLNELDDVMGGELPGSGKKATQLFKSLGISLDEVNTSSPAELFQNMAEKINAMGSSVDRNRAAVLAFGPDGPSLIKDAETLKALGEEYDRIGGFTEDNIKAFKNLGRVQKENDLAWNKLKILLGSTLIPLFTMLSKAGTAVYKFIIDATKGTNAWTVAAGFIVTALIAMNAQSALLLGKWALMALPWLALFLVVEDVFGFFEGSDSLIGHLLDEFGKLIGIGEIGKEAQKEFAKLWESLSGGSNFVESLAEDWEDVKRIFRFGFGETWSGFLQWADNLDAAIANFATTFPGHAKTAAEEFIKGLVDGLTGGASRVWEAVKNVGKGMIDGFRNVLGIHSPSTVFRLAGAQIDEGAAEGIGTGRAVDAAADMASATSDAFAPRVSGGRGGPTTVDARQTIQLEQNFHGMGGAEDVAAAARDGAMAPFNDERRSILEALEPVLE